MSFNDNVAQNVMAL